MSSLSQFGFAQHDRLCQGQAYSFLRPQELPFTANGRGSVTMLFGGLTWKHERLIEGPLAGSEYRCQRLPETDRTANRMTVAIVVAALIIGSSVVITVPGCPKLPGLPFFGLFGFLGALIAVGWPLISIWRNRGEE